MSSVRDQPGSETTAGGHNDSDPVHGDTKARAAADLKESILNRPVVNQKESPAVSLPSDYDTDGVSVYLQLNSVLNMDDSQQIMTSTLVVQITWRDSSLSWSPSNYSGVKIISMDLNLIWTPHVFVLNSPALKNDLLSNAHHLNVQSNGTVYALATITMDTMCSMDHSKFPYDSQFCPIVVTTFDNQISIDVTTAYMDPIMSLAITQKFNWELVSVEQTMINYKAVNVDIPVMQVGLRRRTTFYTVCLVTPMVLTSYTNTLVFLVSLQSGEKVSFLITLLVSTSVYTSFFTEAMPRSLDSVPSTMKLLLWVMAQTIIVLLATLITTRRFHREQEQVGDDGHLSPSTNQPSTGGTTDMETCSHIYDKGKSCVTRVAPLKDLTAQGKTKHVAGARQLWKTGIRAASLDRMFFLLVLTTNTIVLFVLFFE